MIGSVHLATTGMSKQCEHGSCQEAISLTRFVNLKSLAPRQNLWGPSGEHDTSLAAFCESMSRTRIQRRCPRRAGVFRRQTGFSKQELATPSHWRLAASLWSFAVESRRAGTKRSKTRYGLPIHRDSPARSRHDAGPPCCRFFHPPSSAAQGGWKNVCVVHLAIHICPPQPFFPRPPLRSSLRGGRGTSQGWRQACRRERGQARHARR